MIPENIPLSSGAINAHQIFSAQLGAHLIEFTLNFVQTGQWSVDLREEGTLIAAGLMLEPNADILAHLNLGLGNLVFVGEDTTLDNLGVDNTLNWVPPDE